MEEKNLVVEIEEVAYEVMKLQERCHDLMHKVYESDDSYSDETEAKLVDIERLMNALAMLKNL